MHKKFKSIFAVFAGFASVFVLSVFTDFILEKTGVFPPVGQGLWVNWMLFTALAYRSIYAILGGYITARLSHGNNMRNVWILAIIGLIGAIIGIFANFAAKLGPNWYPIWLAILTIPCVWLGGKIAKN